MHVSPIPSLLLSIAVSLSASAGASAKDTPQLFVDAAHGSDSAAGDELHPLKSISAALARLSEPVANSVTIGVTGGTIRATGGQGMAADCLQLMRRMRPGVIVRILGLPNSAGELPKLSWQTDLALVDAREGNWWLENLQVGSGTNRQARGVMVSGPASVTLKDVTFRTRSQSDAAIYAHRGGLVELRGAIQLNEQLHAQAEANSFAGIIATDHGIVRFVEHESAALEVGNGSLSASYYGVIRLGCKTARITSWGEQSNCLAVNNSGRIDLHDSVVRLSARQRRNTPIGLEHDGHVLAEGAHLIIESDNEDAIVLQKASTLTCNRIELRGACATALAASSGSMFVGCFQSDLGRLRATTGGSLHLEAVQGRILGPLSAAGGGVISLPDGKVVAGN